MSAPHRFEVKMEGVVGYPYLEGAADEVMEHLVASGAVDPAVWVRYEDDPRESILGISLTIGAQNAVGAWVLACELVGTACWSAGLPDGYVEGTCGVISGPDTPSNSPEIPEIR